MTQLMLQNRKQLVQRKVVSSGLPTEVWESTRLAMSDEQLVKQRHPRAVIKKCSHMWDEGWAVILEPKFLGYFWQVSDSGLYSKPEKAWAEVARRIARG